MRLHFLILVLFALEVSGQTTIYYNKDGEITIPLLANHHRICEVNQENGVFIGKVEDHRIDSTKLLTLTYDSIGRKNGEIILFDKNGDTIIYGLFENNIITKSVYLKKNGLGMDSLKLKILPDSITNLILTKESFQQARYIRKRDYPELNKILKPSPQASESAFFDVNGERHVFNIVENPAQFPGGMSAFGELLSYFLHYPKYALENKITGKVYLQFIVESNGSIQNVQAVKGIGGGCDEAAIWAIQQMPDWKPGYQHGKAVPVRMVIPVNFQ